ncbi:MAG TPA: ABC transporter permease [Chloroflexota bacterium]|nr:ABC transporter permease [Chloroflexota bacterium]
MDVIFGSFQQAAALLLRADPEILRVMALSLQVSLLATALSLVVGVPLGTWLALARFPGRRLLLGLVNTGMGMPPVVVGLLVTVLLWRSGPLGQLRLLYTPAAIAVAQFLLAAPIVVGLSAAAMQQLNPLLRVQIASLGATPAQQLLLLMREARLPLLAATMAAFGAVISEVGAAMMVGGNIAGQTRVLTTATVLETSKGNFSLALALGLILLAVMYAVNLTLTWVQQRGRPL